MDGTVTTASQNGKNTSIQYNIYNYSILYTILIIEPPKHRVGGRVETRICIIKNVETFPQTSSKYSQMNSSFWAWVVLNPIEIIYFNISSFKDPHRVEQNQVGGFMFLR